MQGRFISQSPKEAKEIKCYCAQGQNLSAKPNLIKHTSPPSVERKSNLSLNQT